MFTGLVQDIGDLIEIRAEARSSRLCIHSRLDLDDVQIGESIAVDGACLTITEAAAGRFWVDVSPETLARTTLGAKAVGHGVHLERALRLADRLGGHLMLGHVDGVGQLLSRERDGNAWQLSFSAPIEVGLYLIPKGCVAVDGVSLTVNQCTPTDFQVTIIPHTTERTRLGQLRVGEGVNLEADVIGKYVASLVGLARAGHVEHVGDPLAAALALAQSRPSRRSEGE